MKLIGNYSDDIKDLIQGDDSYNIPADIRLEDFTSRYASIIKLSVFQNGLFQEEFDLEKNVDFYYKSEQIYLRPNELLDREEFTEGNYTLQFDFIKRYQGEDSEPIYISEISPSRKEIRLKSKDIETSPRINDVLIANYLNQTNTDNPLPNQYKFNTFVEVSGGLLIPINNYAFDKVTDGEDGVSIILKLNTPLPSGISTLNSSFKLARKWYESQTEDIYFVDKEQLATGNLRGLAVDTGYLTEATSVEDDVLNYNELSSGSLDILSDLNQKKKDINLNINFSKFENHVFFGSAQRKLENFKDKVVKLEGLYNQLSASLQISSSDDEVQFRQRIFDDIREEKKTFTVYERFMYNDNQSTTINSAPGLGFNLAGNNFKNNFSRIS